MPELPCLLQSIWHMPELALLATKYLPYLTRQILLRAMLFNFAHITQVLILQMGRDSPKLQLRYHRL